MRFDASRTGFYPLRFLFLAQIVKNYNFVTQGQLKEDQEIVQFCKKCIGYREKLTGDENEVKWVFLLSFGSLVVCLLIPVSLTPGISPRQMYPPV